MTLCDLCLCRLRLKEVHERLHRHSSMCDSEAWKCGAIAPVRATTSMASEGRSLHQDDHDSDNNNDNSSDHGSSNDSDHDSDHDRHNRSNDTDNSSSNDSDTDADKSQKNRKSNKHVSGRFSRDDELDGYLRKRRMLAIVAGIIYLQNKKRHRICSQPTVVLDRVGNISRQRRSWDEMRDSISDTLFTRMFRMTKPTFNRLADLLRPYLQHDAQQSKMARVSCPTSTPLSVELRLAITLRFLAGESYLDIVSAYNISVAEFYSSMWRTVDAINSTDALALSFPYNDEDKLNELAAGFNTTVDSPLPNCVGALDGYALAIKRPPPHVPDGQLHYNRKGFFAMNVQALCDAHYRFMYVSCICAGSTHDSVAFAASSLHDVVQDRNQFPAPYWIAADEAYVACNSILTPWPGRNLEAYKDAFNFYQSSLRLYVEQSFGLLVARWGILWRPLDVAYERVPVIFGAITRLHNFCVKEPYIAVARQGEPSLFMQDECDTDTNAHQRRRDLEDLDCPYRQILTKRLQDMGRVRPLRNVR